MRSDRSARSVLFSSSGLLLSAAVLVFGLMGCVSPSAKSGDAAKETRDPASSHDANGRGESSYEPLVAAMAADFEANHLLVEVEIRSTIKLAALAQKLSASFDLRLTQFLAKPPAAGYSIQTDLDCKLWEAYALTHESEDKLVELQHLILASGQAETYRWFISLFFANRGDNVADILTKAQLTRVLADDYKEMCAGSSSCPLFPLVMDPRKRPFNAFSDREMFDYKQKNLANIAVFAGEDFYKPERGSCFGSEREPSAVDASGGFDWAGHHTSGGSMKRGTYSVTYDDGPHKTRTERIAKMWEASGMPKPTFFWLAQNVKANLALATNVRDRGFTIGSHSWSHPDIGNIARADNIRPWDKNTNKTGLNKPNRDFYKDVFAANSFSMDTWKPQELEKQIVKSTGYIFESLDLENHNPTKDHLFRLPYGSGVKNATVGSYFARAKVRHYFWTIDSLDWQDHNVLSIVDRVQKQMILEKHGIILFHDIHERSADASQVLIDNIKQKKTPVPVEVVSLPMTW